MPKTDALIHPTLGTDDLGGRILALGSILLTVTLATVFLWIGGMKFTDYEAQGVAPFIANNPLLSWLHAAFGIRGGARFLGVYEILTGIFLLGRFLSPSIAIVGAAMSILTYILTLSCMLTTPGVAAPEAGGFPALSAEIGQFLAKDFVLLAASVYLLGQALQARIERGRP
ncbi:MAG: DUF417 family protein [Rhodobacteraceae bacterium]|nr:DUF417 family protein [Paracoccaceae bacterium]